MNYENNGRTLSAMFDSRQEAERAANALREIGATDVVTHGEENPGYGEVRHEENESRGFFDALGDFFFPDDDRAAYAEGLSRGGFLVTATNVPPELVESARDILDREGSVDLDARENEWQGEGWDRGAYLGGAGAATGVAAAEAGETARQPRAENPDGTIEVVEERLNIGKRDVDQGTVRVRSYVREEPVSQDVELTSERVEIERRPVDRAASGDAFRDQTIEAREHAEEAVVEKDARVVEEIELNKTRESHVETVEDTVRKTEVEIEDDDRLRGDRTIDPDRR